MFREDFASHDYPSGTEDDDMDDQPWVKRLKRGVYERRGLT